MKLVCRCPLCGTLLADNQALGKMVLTCLNRKCSFTVMRGLGEPDLAMLSYYLSHGREWRWTALPKGWLVSGKKEALS